LTSCSKQPSVQKPFIEKINIFEANTGGYALYRIPGIVITTKGTLLAYCEARQSLKGDWGKIDILMRRSTDGGKTWEPARKIVTPPADATHNPVSIQQNLAKKGQITVNNPVAIVDQQTGRIHFLYTGPGHGIQLISGRLIVPVWLSTGEGGHAHRPSCISSIYSDDHGKTWYCGEIIAKDPDPLRNPSETVALQLKDGRVMFNIRNESKVHRRAVAFSPDGASN